MSFLLTCPNCGVREVTDFGYGGEINPRPTSEPSFRERGILQTMVHGERKMTMPTWPVRFDGVPAEVKSAPLLGEHTAEVFGEWLGMSAADLEALRDAGVV